MKGVGLGKPCSRKNWRMLLASALAQNILREYAYTVYLSAYSVSLIFVFGGAAFFLLFEVAAQFVAAAGRARPAPARGAARGNRPPGAR